MIRLIIVKPDRQTITIDQSMPAELTVGRSTECSICLDFDALASRNHAVFLIDPPRISVRDLRSTNGIAVNGVKYHTPIAGPGGAETPEVELSDGDQVVIGETKIKIVNLARSGQTKRVGTRRPLTTHGKDTRSQAASSETRYFGSGAPSRPSRPSPSPSPAPETSLSLPQVTPSVPGWVLTRHLAVGSTGSVYLGEEEAGGKRAAIKVMAFGLSLSRSMLDTLRQEVDAARQDRHAHIANVMGAGDLGADGGAYLAYEYVAASNLSVYQNTLEGRRFSYKQAYSLMMQLTDAVCFLHRRDCLHMDLKPTSVLLPRTDGKVRVKLTDHGYYKFLDSSGVAPQGQPGTNPAKLGYVAPEELDPDIDASPAADVFSLSAIFYSMLAGKPPYRFAPGRDSLKVIRDGWIQAVDEAVPGLPVPLVVVIERGLSIDPYLRYSSACELYEALEDCF